VLLAGVAYLVLRSRVGAILTLGEGSIASAVATAWGVIIRLAFIVSCVFAALGFVDFVYQKVRYERGLMMTLEEYKEEMKREEGDPEVRGRIKQIARERVIQQMLAQVPRATAVVTNPTHFAVALYFKRNETPVPVVIAKGSAGLAWRIKAIAQRHGVPILERRELARALYGMVEVNQTIPLELFYAVAEVIAFVEKLRRGA
jgi:flagellar biosynthetic protein FlhB